MKQTSHLDLLVTVICDEKNSHSSNLTIKTEMKFKQKAEANVPYDISENFL